MCKCHGGQRWEKVSQFDEGCGPGGVHNQTTMYYHITIFHPRFEFGVECTVLHQPTGGYPVPHGYFSGSNPLPKS